MQALYATIDGIGLIGPGLKGWQAAHSVLAGQTAYCYAPTVLPVPDTLPPTERRRAGRVIKLALSVGLEAITHTNYPLTNLAAVFASSGADGANCHAICEALASSDRLISPTRFHNSVSNAASGYWSIATADQAPSTVVSAFDASFGAGLLEALTHVTVEQTPCLLIAYDDAYPEPLFSKRPIPDAFGVALLLCPQTSKQSIARIAVLPTDKTATLMPGQALESLRQSIPAARCLPLLQRLAKGLTGEVVLDYMEPNRLALEITRCN